MYLSSTTFSCSWLISLNGFEFIFLWRDSENDLLARVAPLIQDHPGGCTTSSLRGRRKKGEGRREKRARGRIPVPSRASFSPSLSLPF